MKLRALLLTLVALCSWPAYAAPSDPEQGVFEHPASGRQLLVGPLAAPAKALEQAQVLTGAFDQQRFVSEMRQPLTSTGTFAYARGLGVQWHTTKPFDSQLVLTNLGIRQRDDGAETMRLDASEQPAVHMLATLFFSLFTLDVQSLEQSFELYGSSQGRQWVLGLRPKSAAVGTVFDHAVVSGAEQVERIVFTDPRHDRTVITLRDVNISTAPPDATVRALFAR